MQQRLGLARAIQRRPANHFKAHAPIKPYRNIQT
jgi:hypothetical protein